MGVAWQNVAYNQPPHLGYYLPDFIDSFQGNDPSTGIVAGTTREERFSWYLHPWREEVHGKVEPDWYNHTQKCQHITSLALFY